MSGERVFHDPQVNLYARDVETSVRFYRELLGFAETFRTPATGRPVHVEMRLGGLVLGVADIESLRRDHGVEVAFGGPRAEVVVWTDDVDTAYARLLTHGAPSLSPPHDFLEGRLRAAWVADPEGGPVQLVQERAR
ncbi:MAG TPA: VOC family protein [Thermomicrobiaceae bacterium]|nr:VOC family protein [Thermomicrobiaceae bacterium]